MGSSLSHMSYDRKIQIMQSIIARDKQGWTCGYCGKSVRSPADSWRADGTFWVDKNLAVIDHVLARSKGGKNTIDNFVLSCFSCNAKKRDQDVNLFKKGDSHGKHSNHRN